MALKRRLATTAEDSRDSETSDPPPATGSEMDPFSQDWNFEEWDIDAETTDRALTILVAATNLL